MWGPLNRLALGLLFREIGSRLYQPSMILACSELILEYLLTSEQSDSLEHFDEIIHFLIRRNRMQEKDQEDSPTSQFDQLVLQSKRLMALFNFAIQELELSAEFERPFAYTGHDVKKVSLLPSSFLT